MATTNHAFKISSTSKVVFGLSVLVTFFWVFGNLIDIYHFAIIGVVFELLWLPVLLLSVVLPLVCVFFLCKEKFSLQSLYVYSFLMLVVTILVMLLQ
jgi:hypothetical protein